MMLDNISDEYDYGNLKDQGCVDEFFIADLSFEDCLQSSLDLRKNDIKEDTNTEINLIFGNKFKENFFRGMNPL